MAKYAISFRFDNETHGYTYAQRQKSFMDEIRKSTAWEETTSFALITSAETIEALVSRLYLKTHFDQEFDLMIVIDIEKGIAATKGKVAYPATLRSMLNGLIQK